MTNTSTRTAIITGASGGIGRAVTLRLARDGFAVVVNYAGNAAKAEGVVNGRDRACLPHMWFAPGAGASFRNAPWRL